MVGEIGERWIRPSLCQAFDRLADAPVEPYAPRRGQLAVQRLADERVHKAETPGAVRHFCDQLRLHACVDRVEQPVVRHVAKRLEHLDVELAPDDSRKSEHLITRLAQARQPLPDDLLDAFRQAEGRGVPDTTRQV